MYDTVDIRVLLKHRIQLLLIRDVALYVLGLLAADQLYAIDDLGGGVVEIIDDHDLVVGFEQGEGSEGADVACAAANLSDRGQRRDQLRVSPGATLHALRFAIIALTR